MTKIKGQVVTVITVHEDNTTTVTVQKENGGIPALALAKHFDDLQTTMEQYPGSSEVDTIRYTVPPKKQFKLDLSQPSLINPKGEEVPYGY
jgi:hypothetical protein